MYLLSRSEEFSESDIEEFEVCKLIRNYAIYFELF